MLEDVGLGFNTMSNMKNSMPKADNLAKIADYLDVSVDYLLGRTNSPELMNEESFDECQGHSLINPVNVVIQDSPKPSPSGTVSDEGITLYLNLDDIDRAEIRGEMRQMLKAEKYRFVEVGVAARSTE